MQSDPRYSQLMAMANRTKGAMSSGYGDSREQTPNLGGDGTDNVTHTAAQGNI